MSKILAIANQKGGVGKTTTTLNFGACLAESGKKVLMVDFDHQANLTLNCGIDKFDELPETIATIIVKAINGEKIEKLPIYNYRNNLDLIPANVSLSSANLLLIQAMAREFVLKKILEPLKTEYDYILIDCAPSLSVDLLNALTAADEVLIVSNPAKFSSAGTEQLLKSIARVKDNLNPNLEVAGVLFNRVDRRTNFAKDVIEIMRTVWGKGVHVFQTEVVASVRIDESQAMGQSIGEYDKNNKTAIKFKEFTDEYLSL